MLTGMNLFKFMKCMIVTDAISLTL